MEELVGLKLKDIAKGYATTGFIFENSEGKLIGFKVPTKKIEECYFTLQNEIAKKNRKI